MLQFDQTINMNYKDVISSVSLRDNDSLMCVPDDSELMQSLFKDYEEFAALSTTERLERNLDQRKDAEGLSSEASTGQLYVKLEDGSERYITIYVTRFNLGYDLLFTVRLA